MANVKPMSTKTPKGMAGTADKQQRSSKRRVIGRPFKPGQSGNPLGRPKKENTFSDTARSLMASKDMCITWEINGKKRTLRVTADRNIYYGLVSALIIEGLKGDVRAIRELVNRTEGKPAQAIDINAQVSNVYAKMSSSDRRQFLCRALGALRWFEGGS